MRSAIIPAALVLLVLLTAGCTSLREPCAEGSGTIVTEERTPGDFHAIRLTMPADLILIPGDAPRVLIETDDTIIPVISTNTRDGVLTIATTRLCVRPTGKPRVTVIYRNLDEVAILGTGDVTGEGVIAAETVKLSITGAGSMDLAVATRVLATTIAGMGTVNLSGSATDHNLVIPGAGTVNAARLDTGNTTVEITGSGNADVHARDTLSVRITGNGNVQYSGNPRSLQQSVTGIGSVKPAG